VLVHAGPGEGGRDDVGHRHHPHVADRAAHLSTEVAVVDGDDQTHTRAHPLDDQREPQRDAIIPGDDHHGIDVGGQSAPDLPVVGLVQVDDVRTDVVERSPHDIDQAPLADDQDALRRRLVSWEEVRHAQRLPHVADRGCRPTGAPSTRRRARSRDSSLAPEVRHDPPTKAHGDEHDNGRDDGHDHRLDHDGQDDEGHSGQDQRDTQFGHG